YSLLRNDWPHRRGAETRRNIRAPGLYDSARAPYVRARPAPRWPRRGSHRAIPQSRRARERLLCEGENLKRLRLAPCAQSEFAGNLLSVPGTNEDCGAFVARIREHAGDDAGPGVQYERSRGVLADSWTSWRSVKSN